MSTIEEINKVIAKIAQRTDDVDGHREILDLQGKVMVLAEENHKLRNENALLTEKLKTKARLKFENNAYWEVTQEDKREGPFCSKCWDTQSLKVRMLSEPDPQYHQCPTCRLPVNTSGRPDDVSQITVFTRNADPWD